MNNLVICSDIGLSVYFGLILLQKEVLINSYIISNFNYCPMIWMFSSAPSQTNI